MAVTISSASKPFPGESVCGDCCNWWNKNGRTIVAVADGLGHGKEAAWAADAAMACIGDHLDRSCSDIFSACDYHLRNTRGAALALAIIDQARNSMTFAGVGNIRAVLLRPAAEIRLSSTRGIVGAGFANLVPETHPLVHGDVLALYSDGLDELVPLQEVLTRPDCGALNLPNAILERWARDNDDASVLLYCHNG